MEEPSRRWCCGATFDETSVDQDGFIPREVVARILWFSPNYTFRGLGEYNSGLKDISPGEFAALHAAFKAQRGR